MLSIDRIHVAPVKSLGLTHPDQVHVGPMGIEEDRRFFLINGQGTLLTQRHIGRLVQVKAEYRIEPEWLSLGFPHGTVTEGAVELGASVTARIFGRIVAGRRLEGAWNDKLSEFCEEPVCLVKSDESGQCYDEYPISLLSQASVKALEKQAGALDSRRFRPNFLIGGSAAHQEDTWLGEEIALGQELRLQVVARDPRCVITTHDPDTGEADIDTLGLIANYRPGNGVAYFGVYGTVVHPGVVSVGDTVALSSTPVQR